MLAVIELGGNQFIVKVGDMIDAKKLDKGIGETFTVTPLLVSDEVGNEVKIGMPLLSNSKVECKIVEQFKGEKVRVFKMKSKKRYMKNRGFKPSLTKIEVLNIA